MNSLFKLYNTDKSPKTALQLGLDAAIMASLFILIPLAAMFITDEMQWDVADFIIIWLIVFVAVYAFKLLARGSNTWFRVASGLTVIAALFMTWVNLGVGIVGSGPNIPNLLYGGIPVIGFLGAILVKFKPMGMARTLFVMAIFNAIIGLVAIIADLKYAQEESTIQIVLINGFFIVMWVGAGLMFRNAAAQVKE